MPENRIDPSFCPTCECCGSTDDDTTTGRECEGDEYVNLCDGCVKVLSAVPGLEIEPWPCPEHGDTLHPGCVVCDAFTGDHSERGRHA